MRLVLFCLLFLIQPGLVAQEELSTDNKRAIGHYEAGRRQYLLRNYGKAVAELKKAIEYAPAFIEAYLMVGQTYADAGQTEASLDAYQHAVDIDPEFFPNAFFFMAGHAHQLGRYEEAADYYETFLETGPVNPRLREASEKGLVNARFAETAEKNPVEFEPVNLGPNINTPYDEYWPSLSADEEMLVFTTLLPIDRINPHLRSRKQEDLYFSRFQNGQWTQARNVGAPLNTPDNEGAQSISGDGNFMVFTGCGRAEGYGLCDLYLSENRKGVWSIPRNMGPVINTRHSEKQPSLSSDGRILYFASDRPGGKGKYDIWVTERKPGGGWTTPENLGDSINTSDLDQSPF
ncbi:tetratricopeptide repeat protein, partial [Candidatus Poribacteria bacterium]|nr:tetratricopeptide repeat protein [Candidatus Poribacteria bacterium]